MTFSAASRLIELDRDGDVAIIRLARPERGNSLVPDLLGGLVDTITANRDATCLVLTGAGRAFSTGGDVAEFLARAGNSEQLKAYSHELVGLLNAAILALRDHPGVTLAAVNGPVTGGSIGLVLGCDLTLMSRTAFIQPYYARMGFAPDGGWTALMPERIGLARTRAWLVSDERLSAEEAITAGLADRLSDAARFDAEMRNWAHALSQHDPAVAKTARDLLETGELASRLEAERSAFLDLIARRETLTRMTAFLAPRGKRETA